MREAPASVVAAVMGWHGCERVMPGNYCSEHCNRWKERGCGTAVGAADAAWAAAYPEALRDAADRLQHYPLVGEGPPLMLRRWADESEAAK